jgi:rSAM/selenodomain-associated transferase 2
LLSVIIPTLNAGAHLAQTIRSLRAGLADLPLEVIVADGGSIDDTAIIAAREGAIFLETPRGRGWQMAAAAPEAAGEWLLFLHADTRLEEGWARTVRAFINEPKNEPRAAYFRFRLADRARAARVIEAFVACRCRVFGLPYGDQGLLISRRLYTDIGGYKPMPLMEDVDIVNRIGRRNLKRLNARALTSSERFRRDGYLLRPLRNLFYLSLYSMGVSPRYISTLYH